MANPSSVPEFVGRVFRPTQSGVTAVVDDLLALCPEHGIELDWRDDRCCVRSLEVEPNESTEVPLPKSVFRAVLARVAALCNERNPGSVSPYGGEAELMFGLDPPTACRVTFTNTPSSQRIRLMRIQRENLADIPHPSHQPHPDSVQRVRTAAALTPKRAKPADET
jgi:hypothetical protein